jgi:hypothetical protein
MNNPTKRLAALALAATALAVPSLSWSQEAPRMSSDGRPLLDPLRGSVFKCDGSGELVAQFDTRGAQFVAIVDIGEGPHVLPLQPWKGDVPQITWSDGKRTLTWSPGVQIMWMDGVVHRACGRGGEHQH